MSLPSLSRLWIAGALWFVVCTAIVFCAGTSTTSIASGVGAEAFRFAYPAVAALVLAIALMFQTCCPKSLLDARRDRNRAIAAQEGLAHMVGGDELSFTRVSASAVACG